MWLICLLCFLSSDAVQEITAKKEIRLNTSSATQNPESKNSWDYMSLTNIETKTNEVKLKLDIILWFGITYLDNMYCFPTQCVLS